MWQHEIIAAMASVYPEIAREIEQAHTFYFGNTDMVMPLTKLGMTTGHPWFFSGPSVNNLPYSVCLFEYEDSTKPGMLDKIPKDLRNRLVRARGEYHGRCATLVTQVVICFTRSPLPVVIGTKHG